MDHLNFKLQFEVLGTLHLQIQFREQDLIA